MSDRAELERGYQRLLAFYPRSFRGESGQEILGVLLDTASDGQRRPGLAASADLIRGGLVMRLRPSARAPLPVLVAVRLMCAGAVTSLAAMITVAATFGSIRSAVLARQAGLTAAQAHALIAQIVIVEVGTPVMACLWLWLAWANGRGHDWARFLFMSVFGLLTVALLGKVAEGAIAYALPVVAANAAAWCIGLAVMALIFSRQASPYYRKHVAPPSPEVRGLPG
jgi:hypothetical protein